MEPGASGGGQHTQEAQDRPVRPGFSAFTARSSTVDRSAVCPRKQLYSCLVCFVVLLKILFIYS